MTGSGTMFKRAGAFLTALLVSRTVERNRCSCGIGIRSHSDLDYFRRRYSKESTEWFILSVATDCLVRWIEQHNHTASF